MAMVAATNQLQQTQADIDRLNARINLLEQENRWLKQQLFGRSSEKRPAPIPANQSWLFNEAEAVAAPPEEVAQIVIPAHSRNAPGRKPIADDLPRVDIIHDLPEAEKVCPKDGVALECIGQEESKQIDFIPARVQVLNHIRLKYACPCCKSHIKLAENLAQEQCGAIAFGSYRLRQICRRIAAQSPGEAISPPWPEPAARDDRQLDDQARRGCDPNHQPVERPPA
jgi:Transposase C of IS166 homeodomain/zinc-finger binding domain of transposase IS66